jgi:hypothetical protein
MYRGRPFRRSAAPAAPSKSARAAREPSITTIRTRSLMTAAPGSASFTRGSLPAGTGAGSRLFDQAGQVGGARPSGGRRSGGPPKAFSAVPYARKPRADADSGSRRVVEQQIAHRRGRSASLPPRPTAQPARPAAEAKLRPTRANSTTRALNSGGARTILGPSRASGFLAPSLRPSRALWGQRSRGSPKASRDTLPPQPWIADARLERPERCRHVFYA